MRRNPQKIRPESPIKPQRALLPQNLPRTIHHPRITSSPLQPRLQKIKRQTEKRSEKPRDPGRDNRLHLRRQRRALFQLTLGLGEKRQLPEIRRHGANDRRIRPTPQAPDSFCARHAYQRVEDGAVIRAVDAGFHAVALHAHEGDFGRVGDPCCEAAGGERGEGAFFEADDGVSSLSGGFGQGQEAVEEAEAEGGVGELAEDSRGPARPEVGEFAFGDDCAGYG